MKTKNNEDESKLRKEEAKKIKKDDIIELEFQDGKQNAKVI